MSMPQAARAILAPARTRSWVAGHVKHAPVRTDPDFELAFICRERPAQKGRPLAA
jgi:hypothetical protein